MIEGKAPQPPVLAEGQKSVGLGRKDQRGHRGVVPQLEGRLLGGQVV